MNLTHAPRGQAFVEVIVTTGLMLVCLVLIQAAQTWSEQRANAAEAIRLHVEKCRQAPSHCSVEGLRGLLRGQGMVRSHQSGSQIAQSQGSGSWATGLRDMASVGAEQVFSLPDGNALQVTRAEFGYERSAISLGGRAEPVGLSVIPHDWRSISKGQAERRIREGSEPVRALASAIEAAHSPSLYVLMPTTDFLGLDENTSAIRTWFHRLEPLAPAQSLGVARP